MKKIALDNKTKKINMEKLEELYKDKSDLEFLFMKTMREFALKHKVSISLKMGVNINSDFDEIGRLSRTYISGINQETKIE